jgi:hypothetical protein
VELFPHNIKMQKFLGEGIKNSSADFLVPFLHIPEDKPPILHSTWFTNEAHFHLNGYTNKHNVNI